MARASKTWTDAEGIVWRQNTDRHGAPVGRPIKLADPHYEPDWSAGPVTIPTWVNVGSALSVAGVVAGLAFLAGVLAA